MPGQVPEPIVGTIEAFKERGVLRGTDLLLLCFTPERLIVARTGHFSVFPWALFLGIGALIMYPLCRRKARRVAEHLTTLPPEDVLGADRHNFEVGYDEITGIQVRKPGAVIGWPMHIATGTAQYTFGIQRKDDFDAQCGLLRSVVGEKLNIR